jgi:hypothetical protein
MLAAPSADLGAIEDAVMICIHLVEARRGSLPGPILGAFDESVAGNPAGARADRARRGRRARGVDGCGLWSCLGQGGRRQQQ